LRMLGCEVMPISQSSCGKEDRNVCWEIVAMKSVLFPHAAVREPAIKGCASEREQNGEKFALQPTVHSWAHLCEGECQTLNVRALVCGSRTSKRRCWLKWRRCCALRVSRD